MYCATVEFHQVDSSEMYSPDEQGEYMPEAGMQNFSVQGLMEALTTLDPEVTEVLQPEEEYALLLEITVDRPGCPRPPVFSWYSSMVLHVLKRYNRHLEVLQTP